MAGQRTGTTLIAALLVLGGAADAGAQRFGLQASYADDTDFGVGGRIEIPLALSGAGVLSRAFAAGSFDCGLSMYAEARAELGGGEQFVITVGLLLGGNGR